MSSAVERPGRGARLREELREYAIVAVYLYVCFGVLIVYKSAVLRGAGVEYLPAGFAVVKALILGKFMLLGQAAGVGTHAASRSVLQVIGRKSLLFAILLMVLTALEELASGWWRGRTAAATVAELGGNPLLMIAADTLVLLLVLVPFIAVREISGALGPGVLMQALRRGTR